ncbi:hypothetical protein [Oleisolibacter albus]|uniref:hypothetical protein n=1 Tax=Oleisolibacter albus TaxID=2171757 RepID=UPI000DF18EF0|nr:hypothetical protein [Oleisolibacter albus]
MRSPFIEKRRQLRVPVDSGHALVGNLRLPLVNWSQNGLLMRAPEAPAPRGGRLSAQIDLTSAGRRFCFPAELRVVRWQPDHQALAASYVCLDVPVARSIAGHFQPGPAGRPAFVRDAEPPGQIAAPPATDVPSAQKEIAALKAAFARLFHPDTAARDETYALRVELFKEFWSVLEQAEDRVRNGPPLKP